MSVTLSDTTSLTRKPVAYATDSAVWLLRLGAAAIRRDTSSRLSTTGSFCGTCNGFIRAISWLRPSVTSKKNFRPTMVALIVTGDVP